MYILAMHNAIMRICDNVTAPINLFMSQVSNQQFQIIDLRYQYISIKVVNFSITPRGTEEMSDEDVGIAVCVSLCICVRRRLLYVPGRRVGVLQMQAAESRRGERQEGRRVACLTCGRTEVMGAARGGTKKREENFVMEGSWEEQLVRSAGNGGQQGRRRRRESTRRMRRWLR
ncbi:hypothetical protein CYMTET_37802 [Cymbomonas tetramitiformis]|uniref:Uncharacterized protein n=1 Tax=Cymbomonas tetramitiformis TaxID=36881 RepID=A0AAE0CEZ8_9CHLO|nr:hypothetical protein CYMTET_37802 [Cymbomonas tetramitiformis]